MTKVYNSVRDAHQQLQESQTTIELKMQEAVKQGNQQEQVDALTRKLAALTKIYNSSKDAH
jgi:hypothetical protein